MANDPRPSDWAVASNRMMIELLRMTWQRRYSQLNPQNFGSALELMLVSMIVTIGTRGERPFTASQIAHMLDMPRSNVVRHLEKLVSTGTVFLIKRRYVTDLNYLDGLLSSLSYVDHAIGTIERCLTEMKRLRAALQDRMQP